MADAKLDDAQTYVKGDSIVAYIPVKWVMDETSKTPIAVLFKGARVNPYALSNYNFNDATRWEQSRPWDSTHGYFDWTALEDNDEYWESSKWQMEDYTTPDAWCISHVMGMSGLGATVVGAKELTNGDEENPDYAVRLTNTPNPFMPTQVVPGYMTLGTSLPRPVCQTSARPTVVRLAVWPLLASPTPYSLTTAARTHRLATRSMLLR